MSKIELLPCPFCGAAMMERHALWPSEGDTDSIIHAQPTDCPLTDFGLGTADEGVSVCAAWNRRSPDAVGELVEGLRLVRFSAAWHQFMPATKTLVDLLIAKHSPPVKTEG